VPAGAGSHSTDREKLTSAARVPTNATTQGTFSDSLTASNLTATGVPQRPTVVASDHPSSNDVQQQLIRAIDNLNAAVRVSLRAT
jgi:hypothetical protein